MTPEQSQTYLANQSLRQHSLAAAVAARLKQPEGFHIAVRLSNGDSLGDVSVLTVEGDCLVVDRQEMRQYINCHHIVTLQFVEL